MQPARDLDHFRRLGLARHFDLDEAGLEHAYVEQQRALHPDRFVTRGARERRYAAEQSMAVNEAFEVLRDPLTRAEYMLALAGNPVDGEATTDDQELLLEALAARESLEEAGTPAVLAALVADNAAAIAACRAVVAARLGVGDHAGAAAATRRLRYLAKLADEIRRRRLSA